MFFSNFFPPFHENSLSPPLRQEQMPTCSQWGKGSSWENGLETKPRLLLRYVIHVGLFVPQDIFVKERVKNRNTWATQNLCEEDQNWAQWSHNEESILRKCHVIVYIRVREYTADDEGLQRQTSIKIVIIKQRQIEEILMKHRLSYPKGSKSKCM